MLCFNLRFGLGRGDDIVERHIQLHTGAAKAGSITVTVSLRWVGSEKDLRTSSAANLAWHTPATLGELSEANFVRF